MLQIVVKLELHRAILAGKGHLLENVHHVKVRLWSRRKVCPTVRTVVLFLSPVSDAVLAVELVALGTLNHINLDHF
jgi:hypothetical protein